MSFILQRLPEGGIRIFANDFHTHLAGEYRLFCMHLYNLSIHAGRGLTLEQYRFNTECNVWEEVEPIDQNQNYDFNFQQFTYLRREHLVLPVSFIS